MGRLITLLITLLIPPISLAGFLPNRYTRTGEALLGKNLLECACRGSSHEGDPMPKVPAYTLAWSPATEVYELYQTRDRGTLRIVPDSPEWFAWLDQVSSFAFSGKSWPLYGTQGSQTAW